MDSKKYIEIKKGKTIWSKILFKLQYRIICDSCGKRNPKLLKENSRYTECCKVDETYSDGKAIFAKLRFPFKIKWLGFYRTEL